jgi:creatinine amidohydrolase
MKYIDKTAAEWAALNPEIAVLPLGSFEQHGPHMPVNTDIVQIEATAERVAQELSAFLLPVQPITNCYEHHGKRGSVHYSYPVFGRLFTGLAESLYRQGFRKIAVLVGHGGIFILEPAVQQLRYTYPDLRIVTAEYYPQYDYSTMDHAGECETSRMLYHAPEHVHMDKAVDCIPDNPRPYLTYGSFFTHTPSGVWGKATLATAEKGRWLFEEGIRGLLQELREALT